MSRRLILILALAFVVGITAAAFAEVQNVKVSGDLTVMGAARQLTLEGRKNDRDKSFTASITRVKVDADLTDNVMATVRLLNERYWGRDVIDSVDATSTNTDVALDLAYTTLKEFLYSPLTLTIGRQDLHFGSEMIVGDPDTNNQASTASAFGGASMDPDLSARKAFDAIRATLNYDPLVIDAVYAKVSANNSNNIASDNTVLLGVNATYKLNKKTNLEGYWFEKGIGKKAPGTSSVKKENRVDTIGARVVNQSVDNLSASLEVAYQFGKYAGTNSTADSVNRKAWALETGATYVMPKAKMTPTVTALYAYFSGDHQNGGTYSTSLGAYRGWDPMYENQKYGDISNALFDQTNAHILGGIVTAKPMEDVILKGEYYAYWWAKAYNDNSTITADRRGNAYSMTQRRFAGQEVDLTATYNYTEDVQLALMGGWFVPGPSFDKENSSVNTNKIASEVIGSMKVTF